MKQYNNEKYIVSITTFPKRFNLCAKCVFNLLTNQKYKNFHLCLTIFKDEYDLITPDLKAIIDANLVEVIIAEKNLCPHLKYFYCMKKYWDKPIITLDDDRMYTSNIISALVEQYEKINYKSIICNVAPKMKFKNDHLVAYNDWCNAGSRLKPNESSYIAMPEGFGGVLYPSKCFNDLDKCIDEIPKILYHDDMYLKVLEIRNKIKVTQTNGTWGITFNAKNLDGAIETCLRVMHCSQNLNYRSDVTKLFEQDLLEGIKLK